MFPHTYTFKERKIDYFKTQYLSFDPINVCFDYWYWGKKNESLTIVDDELSKLGSIDRFHDASLLGSVAFVFTIIVCFVFSVLRLVVHYWGIYRLIGVVCYCWCVIVRFLGIDENRSFPSQHDEKTTTKEILCGNSSSNDKIHSPFTFFPKPFLTSKVTNPMNVE